MARNFFRRTSRRRVLAGLALLLGLWIALAPFARPLPGGAPYTLEATPEIDCRSPLIGLSVSYTHLTLPTIYSV